jgi:hypothetical protein
MTAMTLIEIKAYRWGWKALEAPGVEPVFPTKDDAISYAQTRARFRTLLLTRLYRSGSISMGDMT